MASLPSSFRGKNSLSTVRYLGILRQSDSPSRRNPGADSGGGGRRSNNGDDDPILELDEGDVVWSTASYSDLSESHSPVGSAGPNSPLSTASTGRSASSLSPSGNYPNPRHHRDGRGRRPFSTERFGLSAALAEEPGPLVQQRKPALDPSAAARTVPPVAVPRAGPGPGPEGHLSSGPGKVFRLSAPVNVPVWPRKGARRGESTLSEVEDWGEEREWNGEDDDGEMVPPHLIVARSHGMTFSVVEGLGRTLKGRDLRRVRNAVFQQTGFLD